MAPVQFWSTPGLYVKWAARNKPAIFWSIVIGSVGPVMALVVPPVRARFGDGPRPQIPLTYPSTSLSAAVLPSNDFHLKTDPSTNCPPIPLQLTPAPSSTQGPSQPSLRLRRLSHLANTRIPTSSSNMSPITNPIHVHMQTREHLCCYYTPNNRAYTKHITLADFRLFSFTQQISYNECQNISQTQSRSMSCTKACHSVMRKIAPSSKPVHEKFNY